MRAKTIAAVLAAAAIAVLCVPAGALARGSLVQVAGGSAKGPTRRGGGRDGRFTIVTQELKVHGSNGYEVQFRLADRRKLEVSASAFDFEHGVISTVSYSLTVPQRPGSDDIHARIGSLGRIDLHFVAEKTKKPKPVCEGGDLTVETGHYVGTISFRGDGGFTRVNAHRIAGTVERETLKSCPLTKPVKDNKTEREEAETVDKLEKEEAAKKAEERGELELVAVLDGGKVIFAATRTEDISKKKPTAETALIVLAKRARGRLHEISLLAQLETGAKAFESPDSTNPTGEAIVTPSSLPFSGSAVFRSEPDNAKDWTGNLKVHLPGMGTVPLAGAGAKATLCSSGCSKAPFSLVAPGGALR